VAGTFLDGLVLSIFILSIIWFRTQLTKKLKIVVTTVVAVVTTLFCVTTAVYGISNRLQTSSSSCRSYQSIGYQQWAEIAKDPVLYRGRCFTIYGQVSQWNYDTESSFFAQVGGVKQVPYTGGVYYPTNTYLTGKASLFTNLVEQDLFKANVMVLGLYTGQSQASGGTVVPELQVDSLQIASDSPV
jgi:hypothetical protein